MRPPTIPRARARRPAHRAPAAHRGAARLLRDARGATIVEFAIVAVPFVALMLAVAVTSLAYFVQETLETAVERAARGIVTGRTQAADNNGTMSGMTRAQLAERFRQAGCASLPAFLPCSRLYVEVKSAVDWTLLDNSPPAITMGPDGRIANVFAYDLGNQGSIVAIRFMYVWPIQTSPLFDFSNIGKGRRLLMATSVAKSETYQ